MSGHFFPSGDGRPLSADRKKKSEKPTRSCAYCGGPMPPPAPTGRPAVYCSISCRDRAYFARRQTKETERLQHDRAQREAEWEAREKKRQAEAEREYQRAIAAGGAVAANARWERLYDETLDKYGRYGLCQWEDEDANGDYLGRRCTRRTTGVYCWKHNRQLDRESERRRREKERATTVIPQPND